MIKIQFLGAAGTVTGSHYVVTTSKAKFAVDSGMFQGMDVEEKNLETYPYDVSTLDFVLLTHAHIDHSGMIPKLIKHGYSGPIYATRNTIQITTELLLDSAKIQEINFEKGEPYGKFTAIKALVYDVSDANKAITHFKPVDFDIPFQPTTDISIKYVIAGHILGAASIEVTINDEGKSKKIVFSGDIGRIKSPIIKTFDTSYSSHADVILMESLYGGQIHPDREETAREFISAIQRTIKSGGSVFIPSFAVERTQELLNDIKFAKEMGFLDNRIKVYLDSPLAQRITRIYENSLDTGADSKFNFHELKYVRKYKESLSIRHKKGIIVIAGSGMADGGRIVTHLSKVISEKRNAVIFVGFQAEGTPGREITEGAKTVMLDGDIVDVKAQIYHFKGFSAHGDTNDYLTWLNRYGDHNKKIFLIHAQEERSVDMKAILMSRGYSDIQIPKIGEEYII
jgi:metallo-beta-lactamase family protein